MSQATAQSSKPKLGFGTSTLRDQETLTRYLKEANECDYDFIDCA